jgi:RNA polymerase sigma factor (sigma-70 family)
MEPTDEALVQACRQGEAHAWEALVLRYQRLIYAIPRRAGLSDEMAADVFQRVWIVLLEHLDRIEQPERIGAWLTTAAKRETWRAGRSQRAVPGLIGEFHAETVALPSDAPLPDDVLEELEKQHMVRTSLAALDQRCRNLLTLLYYRENRPPYQEIARILDMRPGSIGPTRTRCLTKLRLLLDRAGFFEEPENA